MKRAANAAQVQSPRRLVGEIRWEMGPGFRKVRGLCLTLVVVVSLAFSAAAQLTVADYLHMNLNGNIGYTYAGDLNQGTSGHSMGVTGNGFLSGNYYSPNFLNFNISPYYNRDQSNNVFGNLANTGGISSNLNLFGGSHFPGSVSYNRSLNAIGAYGVPGSDLGLAQDTNNQSIGFGWSALLPGLPTLSANYMINDTSNSVLGESGSDTDANKILNLNSTYRWDGFSMSGQFTHRNDEARFSEFLQVGDEKPQTTNSSSNSYGATISHALPFTGSFGASYSHLGYGYDYEDSISAHNSGNSSTFNANAAFHPVSKVGVSFNTSYTDSLLGILPQTVLNTGTPVNVAAAESFHSYLAGSDVFYQILRNLGVHANVQHQTQTFLGQTYSATQFGGSANFSYDHSILKGLSFSAGLVDTAQQQYNTGLGFVGNVNYNRKFWGWDIGGNFSYSQNTATALLIYTTSSYSYMGSARRKIGERKYFMAGYTGAHSGIAANSGTSSSADRIWTGFIFHGNSLNAYYNKSDGIAIFGATGLVSVPTTVPTQLLTPGGFTSYQSKGWGGSLGVNPTKRLIVTVSYGKSEGSTIDPMVQISTNNTIITSRFEYRLRKVFVNGGYTRLQQSVGLPGGSPLMVTSYYAGISRWFNFF